MKRTIVRFAVTSALAAAAAIAMAQDLSPAKPATAPYTGPSSVPLMSVKQLLDTGRDDQHVRLQGRIVSHDGGENYTFADDSGQMRVEISAGRFPAGQPVSATQSVELWGEFDKDSRESELEVDQIRLLP